MPRYCLSDHPYDPELRAEYGFDPEPLVGYFVDCFHGDDLLVVYDASQPNYERDRPVAGALQFFVMLQFFSGDELEDALDALASDPLASPEPVRVSKGVRRVMTVIQNLKKAAE